VENTYIPWDNSKTKHYFYFLYFFYNFLLTSSHISVKYVKPNSLIANINEKIDELNKKTIPNCTLKHSNQKENVLTLISKFKNVVRNKLYQLDEKEADYNLINFDELNDSLEKEYKLLLDEIIQPYEKIDLTDITSGLNILEGDIKKIPVVPHDLIIHLGSVKTNADKVPNLKMLLLIIYGKIYV
jgi:hypothetical protein